MGDDEPLSERPDTLTARVFAAAEHREIPLRTIFATVGIVVATVLLLGFAWLIRTDLILLGVAVFIAVLLAGPVSALERMNMRRSFATAIVFGTGLLSFCGIAYLFGAPLVTHVDSFATALPHLVKQAQHGQGWVGRLVNRLHLHNWVMHIAPKLESFAGDLGQPALRLGAAALTTLFEIFTIIMLSFFMLLDLPKIWNGFLSLLPPARATRVARVAHEASLGVTGYMLGNILTSVIAGLVVFVSYLLFGVPFAGLLALWVALVDLLPIVGGLLAYVPTILIALVHSPTAGIAITVICIVTWQVENHILNPIVMSRTVKMSKLLILIAVIIGATFGGRIAGTFGTFIGALVGIPIGSALQVIVREIRRPEPAASDVSTSP